MTAENRKRFINVSHNRKSVSRRKSVKDSPIESRVAFEQDLRAKMLLYKQILTPQFE